MPFDGKPSLGCETCKRRKLKCDRTTPECQKCIAVGKKCPGIPDAVDQVMRGFDPSRPKRKYEQRAKISKVDRGSKGTATQVSESQIGRTTISKNAPTDLSVLPVRFIHRDAPVDIPLRAHPNVNSGQHALALFFHTLQNVKTDLPVHGVGPYLRLLAPLYNDASVDSTLHRVTSAVSALTLSEHHHDPELQKSACVAYGEAVNALNKVIAGGGPSVTSDETLMSTMLLSLCECFPILSASVLRYRQHLEGAVSLMLLRGKEQSEKPASLALFRAARTQMVFNYVHRKKRIPSFTSAQGWVFAQEEQEDPLMLLATTVLDLPALRKDADSLEEESLQAHQIFDLVHRAQRIDSLLSRWFSKLPSNWLPRHVGCCKDSIGVPELAHYWPGPVHSYCDIYAAYTVNIYRVFRTHVHQVISSAQNALETLYGGQTMSETFFEEITRQKSCSQAIIQGLTDEVCASVPFYLYRDFDNLSETPKQVTDGLRAYYLLHPLFITSCVREVSQEQNAWMRGRLRVVMDIEKDETSPVFMRDSVQKMLGTALVGNLSMSCFYRIP